MACVIAKLKSSATRSMALPLKRGAETIRRAKVASRAGLDSRGCGPSDRPPCCFQCSDESHVFMTLQRRESTDVEIRLSADAQVRSVNVAMAIDVAVGGEVVPAHGQAAR